MPQLRAKATSHVPTKLEQNEVKLWVSRPDSSSSYRFPTDAHVEVASTNVVATPMQECQRPGGSPESGHFVGLVGMAL